MGVNMNDVVAALDLPPAVKIQTLKLLARISQAASLTSCCAPAIAPPGLSWGRKQ